MLDNLEQIQSIVNGLDRNKIANFGYSDKAFNEDLVDGKEAFNSEAEQNIPKASCTDYHPSLLRYGAQSQAASIPRRAWNHFIGRASYNVNKVVQVIKNFIYWLDYLDHRIDTTNESLDNEAKLRVKGDTDLLYRIELLEAYITAVLNDKRQRLITEDGSYWVTENGDYIVAAQ